MSQSIEPNYTGQDYLELHDSVSGAVLTLEQAVDEYIGTLGEYIAGEGITDTQLDHSIDRTVDSLERVYSSLDSLDEMLEDENMVARIQRDGDRGICYLEEDLERLSGGLYDEVSSFEDLLVLFDYTEQDSFEADEQHLKSLDEDIEAPTKIVSDKERIMELKQNLNKQYERLLYSEILARRHTENELTFDPEPPIFRMLGDQDHKERVNKINNKLKKEI